MSELLPSRNLARPFPTNRIAMAGHSVGGAAALIAGSQDSRIRAVVNWDGSIVGSPSIAAMAKPVLFLSRDVNLRVQSRTWRAMWPSLLGPNLWLRLEGATHQNFSDVGTLLEASEQEVERLSGLLGHIEPIEMVGMLVAWTRAWVERALEGRLSGEVIERLQKEFEEVKVVKEGNL